MKYYKVDFSQNLNVIGTTTQLRDIDPKCNYHVDAPYSFKKIKLNEPIKEHIRIPDMLLTPKAKWTDLLSTSMLGYLFRIISNDFHEILNEFNIDDFQTLEIKLTKDKEIRNYKALYFINRFEHAFVNWKECSFGLVDKGFAPIKNILEKYTFNTLEDYEKKESIIFEERRFKLKNLVVRFNRNIELDFFKCLYPISGHFCSERLKDKIMEKGFTGFRFEELHDLDKSYWPIDHLDNI